MFKAIRFFWRFWKVRHSRLWAAAGNAVQMVMHDDNIQKAARIVEATPFCPRCGQVPDGDRRLDEARELVLKTLDDLKDIRRVELDFAIAFQYLFHKDLRAKQANNIEVAGNPR